MLYRQQIRKLATSAASSSSSSSSSTGNSESIALSRKYKFSFEQAKNQITTQSQLKVPSNNIHHYDQYQRINITSSISESDAKLIPSLVALHSRLNLSKSIELNSLIKCLNGDLTSNKSNNSQLSIFGSNLLSYYVTEYLITNYPRLPLSIIRSATDAFIGDLGLYDLAKNQWGVQEDDESNLDRYLNGEPQLFQYGKLKFINNITNPELGIEKTSNSNDSMSKYKAYANFSRSLISVIYAHDGEEKVKSFIQNHILSRKIDLQRMFDFKEPGKLLNILLKNQKLPCAQIKLISESGRQSNSPIFVVGCYSGDQLLSTAEGSSLKEARVRSCVKALLAWYLYKPLDSRVPSDNDFNGVFIDGGERFF